MKDRRKQISDAALRRILPSELRKKSKHAKMACCCKVCRSVNFKQDDLNRWWLKWSSMPAEPTRGQIDAMREAQLELDLL